MSNIIERRFKATIRISIIFCQVCETAFRTLGFVLDIKGKDMKKKKIFIYGPIFLVAIFIFILIIAGLFQALHPKNEEEYVFIGIAILIIMIGALPGFLSDLFLAIGVYGIMEQKYPHGASWVINWISVLVSGVTFLLFVPTFLKMILGWFSFLPIETMYNLVWIGTGISFLLRCVVGICTWRRSGQ